MISAVSLAANGVRDSDWKTGPRPIVVLSDDVFNARSGTVIAMAIARLTQRAGFPLTLELRNTKLFQRSWAKINQVRTLSVERIGKKIGRTTPEELARLLEGLNEMLGG